MACSERGMALINLVLILSVLLAMAHVLAEKVWQSTRQTADANVREQLVWAAQAGVEEARQRLAAGYAGSGGWQTLLAAGNAGSYPSTAAWVTQSNGFEVEIFLRDNLDGDGDARRDNDLKIFVLTRAIGRGEAVTMVESLCGMSLPVESAAEGSGLAASELAEKRVKTYEIGD